MTHPHRSAATPILAGLFGVHPASLLGRCSARHQYKRAREAVRRVPSHLCHDLGFPYEGGCGSEAELVEMAMRSAGRWT